MADDQFQVIVVGGGLAGLTAAYSLASRGIEVLVIEKGNYCGAKNVTGGRLYSHGLEKLFPDFAATAPVERKISKSILFQRSGDAITKFKFDPQKLGLTQSDSYSVLRGVFDGWLAEQAENAGAMIITDIRVDELIVRDGKVCGVLAGEEAMGSEIVILAEGTNALLAQKLGMKQELSPDAVCVGAKEIIKLDPALISQRFCVGEGEGAECMFCGDRAAGEYADGFIYTNKDSLSVGIEIKISDLDKTDKSVPQMLEEFKETSFVASLIEGGKTAEYSAHLLHHGSSTAMGKQYGNGVLLVGDTAGLVSNLGFMVRGMDFAVESGRLAALTAINALESGDCSERKLSYYQDALHQSFISADMEKCKEYAQEGR